MSTPPTDETTARAQRVMEAHLGMWAAADADSYPYEDLLTDDAVHEYPFAPPGFPTRVEGKLAIATYMRGLPKLATDWSFTTPRLYATLDADIVFIEFSGTANVTSTGRRYEQSYLARMTLNGDRMASYREVWNPLAIQDAFFPDGFPS